MKSLKQKDGLWVQWKGRIYKLAAKKGRGSAGAEEAQELAAPYSCKILKVFVQAGQTIKVGDAVLVVEAMKMEYAFTSPRAGTIKKVLVEAGKVVPAGTAFVEWQ